MPNNLDTVKKERRLYKQLKRYFSNSFGTAETVKLEKSEQDKLRAIKAEELEDQYLNDIDTY